MISEFTYQKQLIDLKQINTLLSQINLQTELIPKSDDVPLHLLVGEESDEEGNTLKSISICYLPFDDGELQAVQLLQLYTGFPVVIDDVDKGDFQNLINLINTKTAIGYFGISEQNQIFQRYVYAQKLSSTDYLEELLEILVIYFQMQSLFSSQLIDLFNGETSISEAFDFIQRF